MEFSSRAVHLQWNICGRPCRNITFTYNEPNLRSSTLIFFFVMACFSASAQRKCGTEVALQQQLGKNPGLAKKLQHIEQQLQQKRPDIRLFRTHARVTIPVVVHIVLQNPAQVTDQQVMNQLESVNLDYIAQNTDISKVPAVWQAITGNAEIQFCLAARTPAALIHRSMRVQARSSSR